MIPGPNLYYKCPSCGNLIMNCSLWSGNTIKAKYYSDGKCFASMMPAFPDLTKCKKCDKIFWLSKLKQGSLYSWYLRKLSKWRHADFVEFLGIEDLFRAISLGVAKNKKEEIDIRREILWAYNDRIRNDEEIFQNANDEIRWNDNVSKLLSLLDLSDIDHKIMAAELHRNLGNFEDCMNFLQSIDKKGYEWLKDKFQNECVKENRLVFQIN